MKSKIWPVAALTTASVILASQITLLHYQRQSDDAVRSERSLLSQVDSLRASKLPWPEPVTEFRRFPDGSIREVTNKPFLYDGLMRGRPPKW